MLQRGHINGTGGGRAGFLLLAVGFQARLSAGFFFRLFLFNACLARFEALAGLVGFYLVRRLLAYFALGVAVILHQRNMAGAHVRTGTAFDAVHQVVVLGLFQIVVLGMPVQLLGQQVGRAHFRAGAAAYAGLFRRGFRQLFRAGGDDAVGGFHHGHARVVQGEAHHRPAHHQPADVQAR